MVLCIMEYWQIQIGRDIALTEAEKERQRLLAEKAQEELINKQKKGRECTGKGTWKSDKGIEKSGRGIGKAGRDKRKKKQLKKLKNKMW